MFIESGYDGEPSRASMANGITLSGKQRDQLEESLSVVPVPDEMTACFIPHHFFRYYDANGKEVGEIAACFCCGGVELSPDSAVTVGLSEMVDIDLKKLGILVTELGQPTDVGCGTE